jgi:hypothetical protein
MTRTVGGDIRCRPVGTRDKDAKRLISTLTPRLLPQ